MESDFNEGLRQTEPVVRDGLGRLLEADFDGGWSQTQIVVSGRLRWWFEADSDDGQKQTVSGVKRQQINQQHLTRKFGLYGMTSTVARDSFKLYYYQPWRILNIR